MGIEFPIPVLKPEFEWGDTINALTSFVGEAVTDLVAKGNKSPTVAEILVRAASLAVDKVKAQPHELPPQGSEPPPLSAGDERLREIRGDP